MEATSRILSALEVADKIEMGLCFLCDEPLTLEHQSAHRNIRIILMDMDEEEPEPEKEGQQLNRLPTIASSTVLTQSAGQEDDGQKPNLGLPTVVPTATSFLCDSPPLSFDLSMVSDYDTDKPQFEDNPIADPDSEHQFFAFTEIVAVAYSSLKVTEPLSLPLRAALNPAEAPPPKPPNGVANRVTEPYETGPLKSPSATTMPIHSRYVLRSFFPIFGCSASSQYMVMPTESLAVFSNLDYSTHPAHHTHNFHDQVASYPSFHVHCLYWENILWGIPSEATEYLESMVCKNIDIGVEALQQCECLLPLADEHKIVGGCFDVLVFKACATSLAPRFSRLEWINSESFPLSRLATFDDDQWIEDILILKIEPFQGILTFMKCHPDYPEHIDDFLVNYAETELAKNISNMWTGTCEPAQETLGSNVFDCISELLRTRSLSTVVMDLVRFVDVVLWNIMISMFVQRSIKEEVKSVDGKELVDYGSTHNLLDLDLAKMRRKVVNLRIILLGSLLEYKRVENETHTKLLTKEDGSLFLKVAEEYIEEPGMQMLEFKLDLEITVKSLSELACYCRNKHGVCMMTNNTRIAKTSSAVIVNQPNELELDVCTGVRLFEVKKSAGEYFAFIVDCKEPKSCMASVLLRDVGKDILNEIEKNLLEAMYVAGNIMESPKPLPSGSATEFTISDNLIQKNSYIDGIGKWPYEAVVIVFAAIPCACAQNWGVYVIQTKPVTAQHLPRFPHAFIGVLHRKMIHRGSLHTAKILIKWKALPPKHGT